MSKKLEELFARGLDDYKSLPFWSWNNELDVNELLKQIVQMKEANIGGFIIHARYGLKDEYLSEKWFACVEACLKQAEKLNMKAWIYDENGWPSGFVGGKLLKKREYLAKFLTCRETQEFDANAFCVFVRDQDGFHRIREKQNATDKYYCIDVNVSPANTDILKPEVVDAFLRETHEKYYEKFSEYFGNALAGFFTDEPQCYRQAEPFSDTVAELFSEKGRDVKDGLIYLFYPERDGYSFRTQYFTGLNRLYVKNYYKKIYDWCEEHHCKLTGHSIEEGNLCNQMMGGMGVMTTYEYEHIPAMDWLSRWCGNELAPRQLASVAAQMGKKFVLTETFACSGHDVTPKELKSIAEFQYFNGVNLTCQHLFPYSISAQGKSDHPPVFSTHSNWFEEFGKFNEYFNRLGCLVANTEDRYDIAILHPLRNVYLTHLVSDSYGSVKELEDSFNQLLRLLREHGVQYHFLDETLLEKYGEAEGNGLRLGNCVYTTVLVPAMYGISSASYKLLKQYKGKLCLVGHLAGIDGVECEIGLEPNITLDEILGSAGVPFFCEDGNSGISVREGECGSFVFLKNYSYDKQSISDTRYLAKHYKRLDLMTLETQNIGESTVLGGGESMVLCRDVSANPVCTIKRERNITDKFRTVSVSENWFVMDYASISRDGIRYGKKQPIPQIFEQLLREKFQGRLYVRQTFEVGSLFEAKLVTEKMPYFSATLNGQPLRFEKSDFDIAFTEADVSGYLRIGENVFDYEIEFFQHDGVSFALFDPMATESLKNCLYFDTSVENAYLKGDFAVDKSFVLSRRESLPALTDRMSDNGYPFFKGEMQFEGEFEYEGNGNVKLALDGRFMVADIRMNGGQVDLIYDTEADVTKMLRPGKNRCRITVKSGLRNLFGPHHFKPDPEPKGVNPYMFTFRGGWEGEEYPESYTDNYSFVPFGVKAIRLIESIADKGQR